MPEMAMRVKDRLARALVLFVLKTAGNVRSTLVSPATGARPADQLAGLLHRKLPPAPLQVWAAGARRSSRYSTRGRLATRPRAVLLRPAAAMVPVMRRVSRRATWSAG